jgi:hypothetical protein
LAAEGEFSLGRLAEVVTRRLQQSIPSVAPMLAPKCTQVAPPSEIGQSHPALRTMKSSRPRWPSS